MPEKFPLMKDWSRRYDYEIKLFFILVLAFTLFCLFALVKHTPRQNYQPVMADIGWMFTAFASGGLVIAVFRKFLLWSGIAAVVVWFDYDVLVATVPKGLNIWSVYLTLGLLASVAVLFIAVFKRKVH